MAMKEKDLSISLGVGWSELAMKIQDAQSHLSSR